MSFVATVTVELEKFLAAKDDHKQLGEHCQHMQHVIKFMVGKTFEELEKEYRMRKDMDAERAMFNHVNRIPTR